MSNLNAIQEKLIQHFPEKTLLNEEEDAAIYIEKTSLNSVIDYIKNETAFNFLADLSAVEFEDDFTIVYELMNIENAELLRIKVKLAKDDTKVASITNIWNAADVQEREIFDLFGITFTGHPKLQRILCPDDFVGHPLRKEFKLNIASRF